MGSKSPSLAHALSKCSASLPLCLASICTCGLSAPNLKVSLAVCSITGGSRVHSLFWCALNSNADYSWNEGQATGPAKCVNYKVLHLSVMKLSISRDKSVLIKAVQFQKFCNSLTHSLPAAGYVYSIYMVGKQFGFLS